MKNINLALMISASVVVMIVAAPPLAALAKDLTAKQIASSDNNAVKSPDYGMKMEKAAK